MLQDTHKHWLKTHFPHEVRFDVALAPQAYFKLGGPAEALVECAEPTRVAQLVQWCTEQAVSLTVLSGMSNVVIDDQGIAGVLLRVTSQQYETLEQADGSVLVTAGSGWRTALLVRKTVDDGLTGLEYFLGVPGWLGGALYNNAHYTTELIADHVMKVQVITREGELKWLDRNACAFGYDDSRFHTSGEVIIAAQFSLQKGEKAKSLQLIQDSTRSRALSQPLGTPSSGCYFRNVPNTPLLQQRFPQFAHKPLLSAGFLIDQAGLKKQRVGDIMVSEKHAAFLVNVGQGTSAQVAALAQHIKDEIRKQFSVELIPEVFWIGKR